MRTAPGEKPRGRQRFASETERVAVVRRGVEGGGGQEGRVGALGDGGTEPCGALDARRMHAARG